MEGQLPNTKCDECPGQHGDTDVSSRRQDRPPCRFVANHHGLCQHKVRNAPLQAKIVRSSLMRHAILTFVVLASSIQ